MNHYKLTLFAAVFSTSVYAAQAQTAGQPAPDHPAVTVHGQTYTPRSILARNMGTPEDQATQFPPHKIIGNIYYVGTKTLSSCWETTHMAIIRKVMPWSNNKPAPR